MEISYTDEFNRPGTVYFVNDHVAEPLQCIESDESDSMSTCSTHSASTITSSQVSDFYQEKFGRVFPVDDNLPVLLQLLLGSNYFGPFRQVMEHVPHPRVLDIRTKEGTWVQEVAAEFPHAHFISLDVVPMIPHIPRSNITFEVYDLYAGLAEPDESFDVVHARDCLDSVKNYDMLLREIHRVLKPGGLLLIGELGRDAFEASDTDVPAIVSAPHIHHGLKIVREAISAQGVMLDLLPLIPQWLEPDSALWDQNYPGFSVMTGSGSDSSSDMGSSPMTPPLHGTPTIPFRFTHQKRGFASICQHIAHIPNGTWPDDPTLKQVGALAQAMWKETWLSIVPLLLEHSVAPELVRQIVDGAIQELCDPNSVGGIDWIMISWIPG
ncbi:methyltransferase domain protein [Ceratobasidium sp. AG-Ba]|nr:methyltransferase domain protein [Ceratobasidium sp. AG-Ba]